MLYAAFANRFHIQHATSDKIFITDRHSVTTWLIFQKDMPMNIRKEIYKFGIEALQTSWLMIYLDIDVAVARERKIQRDKQLESKWVVRKNKSNDNFTRVDFDALFDMYKKYLIPTVEELWIPTHTVLNTWTVQQSVDSICQKIVQSSGLLDVH